VRAAAPTTFASGDPSATIGIGGATTGTAESAGLLTSVLIDPNAVIAHWWLSVALAFALGLLVGAGLALRLPAQWGGLRPAAAARAGAVLVAAAVGGLVVVALLVPLPPLPRLPYPSLFATPTPDRAGWPTPPAGYGYPPGLP
jgi:hypothetical protein